MKESVLTMLKGAVIGAANAIPGVSGGTMALLLGIYERLISLFSQAGPHTLQELFEALRSAEARRLFIAKYDIPFLLALGVGAGVAIVILARVLRWSLSEAHDPTYGFFFGLVLLSVWAPLRLVKKRRPSGWAALIAGGAAVVLMVSLQSPQEKLQNQVQKQVLRSGEAHVLVEAVGEEGVREPVAAGSSFTTWAWAGELKYVPVPPPLESAKTGAPMSAGQMFLSGALAISAMILPGVSGAFVLLLLGSYFTLLDAVAAFQVLPLAVFALGCVVGLATFSKLIQFLLRHAHDVTMMFLGGLVAGSLYAIWPFQAHVFIASQRIDLAPVLPPVLDGGVWATLGAALVGACLVALFYLKEARQAPEPAE